MAAFSLGTMLPSSPLPAVPHPPRHSNAVHAAAEPPRGVSGHQQPRSYGIVEAALVLGFARHARRSRRAPRAARQAAKATKASHAKEVDELLKEAAKLKADVKKFEDEQQAKQTKEQWRWFSKFDTDGSGGIDAAEIRQGMQELVGHEVNEDTARRLLEAHDANKDGVLNFEEFNTTRLESSLAFIQEDERDRELNERRLAREKEERFQAIEAHMDSLPEANEDTGLVSRLVSMAVYLLPILDALRLYVPLLGQFPELQTLLTALSLGFAQLPGIHLISFVGLQVVSQKADLPCLVRYNSRQTLLLDIAVGLFNFTVVATKIFFAEATPSVALQPTYGIICLGFLCAFCYSIFCSALGEMPKGIPAISEYAENTMAPTRPSNWRELVEEEEEEHMQKEHGRQA